MDFKLKHQSGELKAYEHSQLSNFIKIFVWFNATRWECNQLADFSNN